MALLVVDGDRLEDDLVSWLVVSVGVDGADLTDDVHAVSDFAEDGVAVVEVRLGGERDEKLRAVGVRAGVCHAQNASVVVAQLLVELVVELIAGAAATGFGWVATLNHEALDDAVEGDIVVQRLALDVLARLGVGPGFATSCEADEVIDGPWCAVVVQFDIDVSLVSVEGRSNVSHSVSDGGPTENDSGLESRRDHDTIAWRQQSRVARGGRSYIHPDVERHRMTTGTHTSEEVTLARLPSGMAVTTTIHRYRGADDGPTCYVQGAQHGREINGTEALRRFHDRLPLEELSGTVITVPVANPLTFDRVSYTTPEVLDSVNPNMNRIWPGDAEGSLHQRMAARLWAEISQADAVVDLHTGSPDMLPHVVYQEGDEDTRQLAEAFGTGLLLSEQADDDAKEEWHQRGFAGKLRVVAAEEGIPAITPELAHNKQIVEAVVEIGVDGLLDVCRHLGMLPGDVPEREQTVARNHLGQVTATDSGLFRPEPTLEVGQFVSEGTTVGTVYDPTTYEPLYEASADRSGLLYVLTQEATVVAGDQLASVALVRDR